MPQAIESLRAPLRRGARLAAAGLAGRGRGGCGAARCPPVTRDAWRSRSGGTRGWWSAATTFTGDLARRLGWANVFADSAERYPHVDAGGDRRGRRRRRAAARRALRLHRRGRSRGVLPNAHPAGQRPAAHVVRPVAARGPRAVGRPTPRKWHMSINNVGVVGCGLMGSGIAEVCARAGLDVVVVESSKAAAEAGRGPARRRRSSGRRRSGKLDDRGPTSSPGSGSRPTSTSSPTASSSSRPSSRTRAPRPRCSARSTRSSTDPTRSSPPTPPRSRS